MTALPTVGIAGPVSTALLQKYLYNDRGHENQPIVGMGGISVCHVARGLLDRGLRVHIYTLDPNVDDVVVYRGEALTVYVGPFRRRGRMRDFMRQERRWIQRFIQADPPDLVHAHWTYEYALGALAASPPTVVTVRDWPPAILQQHRDLYRLGRLLMSLAVWAKGRHFIANSPYIQARVQPLVSSPVPVIPNGIDDSLFTRRPPPPTPVLVSVNNGFRRRKNLGTLLKAFAHIRRAYPDVVLRLVGKEFGPDERAHCWARAHGLTDGVDFVGYRTYRDALDEIRHATLLVHPALEESFGMTLLEAMASGVAVVAGKDSGAVPWVTDHGSAACLTDVSDPDALADAVIGLLDRPAQQKRWAEAGYDHAWTHFRLSTVVRQHLDVYADVLDAPGGHGDVLRALSSSPTPHPSLA